jgi:methionyl-tRNA formyltransferase
MAKKLNILFMGSPEFAAHCLDQLVADGFNIKACITGPDRKKGRGLKLAESAVKTSAKKNQIPVYQPTNLKDASFISQMKELNLDLGIVVAFRMLPEVLWNLPRLGTINLHASLLPNYRGAAPINWAIINGEVKTGITTFFLKHEIDTGDVILRAEVPIGKDMCAGELHDKLMQDGALLLSDSVKLIESGEYQVMDQAALESEEHILHKAPKIFKEDCRIDWDKKAAKVHNLIRGLSPYPAAWSKFLTKSGKELIFKVYKSEVTAIPSPKKAKVLITNEENEMLIKTSDFYLKITDIQIEGKQRMFVSDFLRGFNLDEVTLI